MLHILIALSILLTNFYIIFYLYKLETIGCKCAINWRRIYIMIFFGFNTLLMIANIFFHKIFFILPKWYFSIYFILAMLNIIFSLQYLHYLKNCLCSEDTGKLVLEIVTISNVLLYGFSFIITFYTFIIF